MFVSTDKLHMTQPISDPYYLAVSNAVAAVRSDEEDAVFQAFQGFGGLIFEELLAELFNWVDDATTGRDVDMLLASTSMSLPPHPKVLVSAVKENSLKVAWDYCNGEIPILITSMVMLIAALPDPK